MVSNLKRIMAHDPQKWWVEVRSFEILIADQSKEVYTYPGHNISLFIYSFLGWRR